MSHARRPVRRLFVAAAFLGYPLMLAGYATLVDSGRVPQAIWGPIAVALFSITLFGLVAIYAYSRQRAQMDNARLDERERTLATRSYALSYSVLFAAVTAAIAALVLVASFGGPITLGMDTLGPIAIAIGVYLPALPSAVLAWIEPDWMQDEVR